MTGTSQATLNIDTADLVAPAYSVANRIADMPEILRHIVGYLDDGEGNHLVRCLQTSSKFFEAASQQLCRRITIPAYIYNVTQKRDEQLYERPCLSCYGEQEYTIQYTPGTTTHFSRGAKHTSAYIESVHNHYRALHPASSFMSKMYTQVRVMMMEKHSDCALLAQKHPLPNVRTVIARACQPDICIPADHDQSTCGVLPTSPFRLVLDGCCPALVCGNCTSKRLFTKHIQTLALRLRMDYGENSWCKTGSLPLDCRPERLVVLFPNETFRREIFPTDDENGKYRYRERPELPKATKPEHEVGKKDMGSPRNWFFRIASNCLIVPDECEILIVGADRGALYIRDMSRYDNLLPRDPEEPSRRYGTPSTVQSSSPGSENSSPGTYDLANMLDGNGIDCADGLCSREPAPPPVPGRECNRYSCYSQSGKLVSARITPGMIAPAHVPVASDIIARRVAVLESVLHAWIDHLLDQTLPQNSPEAEKDEGHERQNLEQYYRGTEAEAVDEKELQEDMDWFNSNTETDEDAAPSSEEFDVEQAEKDKDPDACVKEIGLAPGKVELEARRVLKHRNIRFITLHEYHKLEGNNDEMDDPALYL